MLHGEVLFVGDRPNPKKNLSFSIPFVGTTSYKTLLEWFYRMNVDFQRARMQNAFDVEGRSQKILVFNEQTKVIALGEAAYAECKRQAIKNLFKLPHPSGANLTLNDHKAVSDALSRCRRFIYD